MEQKKSHSSTPESLTQPGTSSAAGLPRVAAGVPSLTSDRPLSPLLLYTFFLPERHTGTFRKTVERPIYHLLVLLRLA